MVGNAFVIRMFCSFFTYASSIFKKLLPIKNKNKSFGSAIISCFVVVAVQLLMEILIVISS